jgi:hypothetical protein
VIRVTIELLPGGDEKRARTIGLVEIANIAVLPGNFGEYAVILKKCPPFTGALRDAWRRGRLTDNGDNVAGAAVGDDDEAIVALIGGHHRTRRGVYDLLYRALRACGLEARNPENATSPPARGRAA